MQYNLLQKSYDLHAQYFIDGLITYDHFLDFECFFNATKIIYTINLN